YQRQKSALERKLGSFLSALSPPKAIPSATSENLIKFLISRDNGGRTVVHNGSCTRVDCGCPTRLASGSVDFLIGKLKAIYNNL
ncbi:predicted protein, partial [Nematostella vectensis]